MEENQVSIKQKLHSRKKIELPTEEIISQCEEGIKQNIIAKRYNVSDATISKRINEYYKNKGLEKIKTNKKIKREKKGYPNSKNLPMEEVIQKLENKVTQKELTIKYNVSYTTLRKKVKRYYKENDKPMPLFKRGQRKRELPIEEIIMKYENGTSRENLAEEYKVSMHIINSRIAKYYRENGKKERELPIEKIIQEYENGITQMQLADKYKRPQSTISKKIMEYYKLSGIEKPKHKVGPKTKDISMDDVIRKYENGISQAQLARDYDVNPITIGGRLDKYYQTKGEKKPRILTNIKLIEEYIRKGLSIDKIMESAENKNIIIPHHYIEKALERINKKNFDKDKGERG